MHAIQRAWEHYAVDLSLWELKRLERQIRDGRARYILGLKQGRAIYRVETSDGFKLFAVYRADIGRVVTFYSPQDVRRHKEKTMSNTTSKLATTLNLDIEAIVETEGDGYVLYHPDDPETRFSGATVTEAFKQMMPYVLANADFEFADA